MEKIYLNILSPINSFSSEMTIKYSEEDEIVKLSLCIKLLEKGLNFNINETVGSSEYLTIPINPFIRINNRIIVNNAFLIINNFI